MKRLVFQVFPSIDFWCTLSSPVSSCVHFFRFRAVSDHYGAKEDRPSQATPLQFHIPGDTSPSRRSASFHLSGGRSTLSDLECVLQFYYPDSRLAGCSPDPRSGLGHPRVLRQPTIQGRHHSICPGRWVDFGAWAINRFYQLWKDDSEEYQALFVATDFEGLMQDRARVCGGATRRQASSPHF